MIEHDPIQRWLLFNDATGTNRMGTHDRGDFVRYADHVAALAARDDAHEAGGPYFTSVVHECCEVAQAAKPRTLTADEWEQIAKQFRMAYQLGACDPADCPKCDCNMDDEGRAQLAGLALQQASVVISLIHDSGKEEN